MAIKLGQTFGIKRKYNVYQAKPFYKPALKKLVMRHPGVLRKSDKVLERNREIRELKPAALCGGPKGQPKAWADFVACLSNVMTKKKAVEVLA